VCARRAAAVITMLKDGINEGWEIFGNWMDRDRVEWTKQDEVVEWLRQEVQWEEIQVARILRVFHMLVKMNWASLLEHKMPS
jgi:hypothetical protein